MTKTEGKKITKIKKNSKHEEKIPKKELKHREKKKKKKKNKKKKKRTGESNTSTCESLVIFITANMENFHFTTKKITSKLR